MMYDVYISSTHLFLYHLLTIIYDVYVIDVDNQMSFSHEIQIDHRISPIDPLIII